MELIGPVYAPRLSFQEFGVGPDATGDYEQDVKDALERAKLYVKQWGDQHGLKVVIKRSKNHPRRRVYLGCSHGGKPRRQIEGTTCRYSDKIDCPFTADIIYGRGAWTVWSAVAEHNHGPSFPQEGPNTETDEGQGEGQGQERPKKRQRRPARVDADGGSFINYQLPSK